MSVLIRRRFSKNNDVTLFHGDCLELLRAIPTGAARLIITSPPYNNGKPYEQKQTLDEYLRIQERVVAECVRIVRRGGSICWQVGNHVNGHGQIIPLDVVLHPLFAKHEMSTGIRLRNRVVWHFEHGLHCTQRFSGRYEIIMWYTKGDSYLFNLDAVRVAQKYPGKRAYRGARKGLYSCNPRGKNPGDVWVFPNVKANHVEKTVHPCQFPVELPERLIRALSRKGELVVDPFLGVGTTAVAALLLGRRAAGADVKEEYLAIARERIRMAVQGKLRIRPSTRPVYTPRANTRLTIRPSSFDALPMGSSTLATRSDGKRAAQS